jgi:arylsulfatase A-like enzyme
MIKTLNQQAGGTVSDTPVMSIDLLPTLADISGVKIDRSVAKEIDGISLKKLLTTGRNNLKRESLFWHYPHYHSEGATPYSAVRNGDWKLIHIIETDSYELYNLKDDIGEQRNLIDENPKVKVRLQKELENWKLRMNAQMPTVR